MIFILPLIVAVVVAAIFTYKLQTKWLYVFIICAALICSTLIVVVVDFYNQTTSFETWSGTITNIEHKEEWNEWHPERTETYTTTDSNGKTTTHTRTIPGYWEHHYAKNYVTTSDNGTMDVDKSQDGKVFDDSYPNTTAELGKHYVVGAPSASSHMYTNKVKASYSIYRHKDINPKEFPGLPDYPRDVTGYVNVNRIIGNVPNKDVALANLAKWNSYLNKSIPDPDKAGKTRSYKQVNVIFVNLGDKSIDWAYALQDKWQGGNKNDFVVAFGTDANNNVTWAYPFSWSEVEILKLEVRDYMLETQGLNDFNKVVDDTCKMVEAKFERKQFADFDYLHIEVSTAAKVIIWIIDIIAFIIFYVAVNEECDNRSRKRYY